MKFMIPGIEDPKEAEDLYLSLIGEAEADDQRIYSIRWMHNEKEYFVEVGKPIHAYFGGGVVHAIIRKEHLYQVFTTNRGIEEGPPVYIGAKKLGTGSSVEYFES
jgi:hypothetical protein